MKKFMGTPGPWFVKEIEIYEDGSKEFEVTNENGDIVCDNETYYPHAVSAKDAHLIAAAPDMLEALQELIIAAENISGEHVEGFASLDVASNNARAAIAKALGE